ncbi:MAG TPA: DUF2062 domain-containing protein [Aestuariivirgaceae bacterium]|nr:DUF2062 domain-containing protein [Aestuariivirgaceae bacterium]
MLFRRREGPTPIQKTLSFLWPRRGLQRGWRYLWHRVTRISATPHTIALGVAIGAFASFTPFMGLHFLIAALLALILGGSILASALGTAVGNPLTFPFIWLASYNLGALLLGYRQRTRIHINLPDDMFVLMFTEPLEFWRALWRAIDPLVVPMLVGGIPLGLACGVAIYIVVRSAVAGYQHRRQARICRENKAR